MKYIYVLENDSRTQQELFETLKSIDPALGIRFFQDLAQFHEWLKVAIAHGPMSLSGGGQPYSEDPDPPAAPTSTDELRLVIAKDEFLGTRNMSLIRRARDFFIRKKMCSELEPTALILTAFDSPDFDIKLAEERIINNVIFKPFDKLILKQHIEYALSGRHPVKTGTVAAMQIKSTIEMLKEVSLDGISEIGFTSFNNHDIRIGSLTKYYSDSFKAKNQRSAYAYCSSSKEIAPEKFICEFRFFGLNNLQISEIRKHVISNPQMEVAEIKNSFSAPSRFVIIAEDPNSFADFQTVLSDRIENAEVYTYTSYGQLISDLEDKETAHRQQLPDSIDYIIAHFDIFQEEQKNRWDGLLKVLQNRATTRGTTTFSEPTLYLFSKKEIPMDNYRSFAGWVKDVFYTPLDKNYFMKKLTTLHPGVINKESVKVHSVAEKVILKVANPVDITEISEAGLIMKYYRSIGVGSFREFVLWLPDEIETPEIIGACNFAEKDKNNKGVFLNHFVFFGMKDIFLKHLRLWVRDAYIKSKDKG